MKVLATAAGFAQLVLVFSIILRPTAALRVPASKMSVPGMYDLPAATAAPAVAYTVGGAVVASQITKDTSALKKTGVAAACVTAAAMLGAAMTPSVAGHEQMAMQLSALGLIVLPLAGVVCTSGFSRKPVTQSEARARAAMVLAMEAAERKAAVGGTDAELRARMAMALEHENAPSAEWAHSDVGDDDAIEGCVETTWVLGLEPGWACV